MPFVEGQASSSKGADKKAKNGKKAPLVKTNVAKRTKQTEELRELQRSIDNYVSVLLRMG